MDPSQTEGFLLSPQQRRLWHVQGETTVLWQAMFACEGNIEADTVRQALEDLVERHEILRTTFQQAVGFKAPLQAIHDTLDFGWTTAEAEAGAGLEQRVEQARVDMQGLGQDGWAKGPLLHGLWIRLGPEEHRLVLTVPALVADRWSLETLRAELAHRIAGDLDALEEEPLQYADFSDWQSAVLEGDDDDADSAAAFWSEVEAARGPWRPLPGERVRPATPAGGDAFQPSTPITLDGTAGEGLATAAKALDASAADVALAAWSTLLWRLGGGPRITLGLLVPGRPYDEMESGIGPYAKALPLTLRFERGLRFADVVGAATAARRGIDEWQGHHLWGGGDEKDEGAPKVHGLFEDVQRSSGTRTGEVTWHTEGILGTPEPCDLHVLVEHGGDAPPTVTLTVDGQAFDPSTAEDLARRLAALLEAVAEDPNTAVERLPAMDGTETERLVHAVNATARTFDSGAPVHHRIAAIASETPDAVAVVFEDQTLTYGELVGRAHGLSHRLRELGVGPEVPVGLLLDRSPQALVALLGVLGAGGAYLPLDPFQPTERLTKMCLAAGLRHMVVDGDWGDLAAALAGTAERIHLDTLEAAAEPPAVSPEPENLAYVLFTSGSTGEPKGVAVEHRHLGNYLDAAIERLDLPAGADYGLVSTLAADLGLTMLFPALVRGGRLHVLAQERMTDPAALADYLQRNDVDALKIVPTHLEAVLAVAKNPARALPRRILVSGGEALTPEFVRRLRALAPDLKIHNHYGPTETTVGALAGAVGDLGDPRLRTVSLGAPLANLRVHVVDPDGQPVPTWCAGEVMLSGAGVSRGYLGRPALTAERFLPDPFADEPGGRAYRTGDQARHTPEGLEFLGRVDHQLNVRGNRVEPGEVEAALLEHSDIHQAVVVGHVPEEGEGADVRLVAYVVPHADGASNRSRHSGADEDLGNAALREHLRPRLPEAMIPSVFVQLPDLPLNRNGKVDRDKLPDPSTAAEKRPYVAPRNDLERRLCDIWAEVFELDRVGRDDNFFALGGHSLLATRVAARLREVLGVDISLQRLFDLTTVADLAAEIESTHDFSRAVFAENTSDHGTAKTDEAYDPLDSGIVPGPTVDDFLSRLEEMSDDEVRKKLEEGDP